MPGAEVRLRPPRTDEAEEICAAIQQSAAELAPWLPDLTAGLTQLHSRHHFANLYYWVRSGHTGRGLASAAARELACFGLQELGLQRIEIVVARDNLASLRVAEKAGAAREGLLRSRLNARGVVQDAYMFSLVAHDFEQQANSRV